MKYERNIVRAEGGFKVIVWDNGYVALNDYNAKTGRWEDCVFSDRDDAVKAYESFMGW